ncbi:MAG: FecR domain-containing protein, partial [Sandaracinaceae bacterium]
QRTGAWVLVAFGVAAAAAIALFVAGREPDDRAHVASPDPAPRLDGTAPTPVEDPPRREEDRAQPGPPTHLAFRSGDQLTSTPGSRFEILRGPAERPTGVRLESGAMLFDVAPRAAGERFEVLARDVTVTVIGTVFVVEVGASGVRVRVHEGRVHVRGPGEDRTLVAGDVVVLGELEAEYALEDEAVAAASLRTASRSTDPPRDAVEHVVAEPEATPANTVAVVEGHAPPSSERREPTADDAAQLVIAGHPEEALALAGARREPAWIRVEVAAYRSLGRWDEAVTATERATAVLTGSPRAELAYAGAELALSRLRDPRRALALLDRGDVTAPSSPMLERGLSLRFDAQRALSLHDEARATADAYLARFPRGPAASRMRSSSPPSNAP